VGLRTPFDEAERIKKKFGVSASRFLPSDDVISVPSVGGRRPREVSRKILCEIIEPRVDEILSLARQTLVKEGLEGSMPSGVVLTGGCSALEGLLDLAEEIFEAPVRLGIPVHVGGLQDVVRGPTWGSCSTAPPRIARSRASASATTRSSAGSSSACGTGSISSNEKI
jgi:cell division protein FtsA